MTQIGQDEYLLFDAVFSRICGLTEIKSSTDLARALRISNAAISKQKVQNKFPASWAIQIAAQFALNLNFIVFGVQAESPSIDERQRLHDSIRYYIEKQFGNANLHGNDAILNIIVADVEVLINKYITLAGIK